MAKFPDPEVGDIVFLAHEEDCLVPAGEYEISQINADGSFHVGGNTAIWPRRILHYLNNFSA